MLYPNAHTHRQPAEDEIAVVNLDKDLDMVPDDGYYSAGIHPWFIRTGSVTEELERLRRFLELPNIVALGECGLDRLAKTPWNLQCEVFQSQLALANEFGKPVIIHNVRAGSELLHIRKSLPSETPWLLHGFHGSLREAELFLQQGCYLGFGKHLFNPKSKAIGVAANIPAEQLLPETDDSDYKISEVIAKIALIRNADCDHMARILYENFIRFFGMLL